MIKMFCDCCGREIEHKHEAIEITFKEGGSFTTGSPAQHLLCKPCAKPVQKILTGNGRVG